MTSDTRIALAAFAFAAIGVIGLGVYVAEGPAKQFMRCEHGKGQIAVDACTGVIQGGLARGRYVAWAYVNRGNGHLLLRQNGPARKDFDTAITLNQTIPAAYFDRGLVRMMTHDNAGAIDDFDAALRLSPKYVAALRRRGAAYLAMGQAERALQDFDAALRLKPDDVGAIGDRAMANITLHRYDLAIRDFDTVARLLPDNAAVLTFRSWAYAGLHRYDLALKDSDAAVRLAANAEHLNNRCWTRAMWGQQLDTALADCNAALRLAPNQPAYLDSRAFVEYRQGHYAKAISDESAALAKKPGLAVAFYVRGLAKRKSGDKSGGDADIAAAEKIAPKIADTYAGYGVTP